MFIVFANIQNLRANEDVYISNIEIAQKYAEEKEKTLLLIFTADWCRYCKPLHDAIDANQELVNEKYIVCYVDFDKNKDLVRKYNVGAIPTTIIIKETNLITKIVGFSSFTTYRQKIGL
jgi:thioredoxin-like negative regulator of GroEL